MKCWSKLEILGQKIKNYGKKRNLSKSWKVSSKSEFFFKNRFFFNFVQKSNSFFKNFGQKSNSFFKFFNKIIGVFRQPLSQTTINFTITSHFQNFAYKIAQKLENIYLLTNLSHQICCQICWTNFIYYLSTFLALDKNLSHLSLLIAKIQKISNLFEANFTRKNRNFIELWAAFGFRPNIYKAISIILIS